MLFAGAVRAQRLEQPLTPFVHFAVSGLWYESGGRAPHAVQRTGAFLPIELGLGVWESEQVGIVAFARAGILQIGGGVMLTVGQSRSLGGAFRLGPVVLSDGLTCFSTGESPSCTSATYVLAEVGPEYRLALGSGSISIGFALNLGARRTAAVPYGATWSLAGGVLAPRLQVEF